MVTFINLIYLKQHCCWIKPSSYRNPAKADSLRHRASFSPQLLQTWLESHSVYRPDKTKVWGKDVNNYWFWSFVGQRNLQLQDHRAWRNLFRKLEMDFLKHLDTWKRNKNDKLWHFCGQESFIGKNMIKGLVSIFGCP